MAQVMIFQYYLIWEHTLYIEGMHGSRRETGVPTSSNLKNHKIIGFLSNNGPDPLQQSQNSMFGHHRHASETPLQGDDGPLLVLVFFSASLIKSNDNLEQILGYINHMTLNSL